MYVKVLCYFAYVPANRQAIQDHIARRPSQRQTFGAELAGAGAPGWANHVEATRGDRALIGQFYFLLTIVIFVIISP